MLLVVLPLVFLPTTIRSLTRAWLVKWTPRLTKLVTGARVARLLPNSRATYIPSTHTGQWARTGYLYRLLSLPLLPGPDRPPHEATERLFASRRGGEDEGNALCSLRALSLSLYLSLSLTDRVRFLAFFSDFTSSSRSRCVWYTLVIL
jgi:hypothetical protein